jgi:hypothetical protein
MPGELVPVKIADIRNDLRFQCIEKTQSYLDMVAGLHQTSFWEGLCLPGEICACIALFTA